MLSHQTIGTNHKKSEYVHSVFDPLPWQVAPWRDKSKVLLLTGSAGGGKSRLAAEKVHGFMLKYPNATGLAMRKAREFATKSIVPMLRRVSASETELVETIDGRIVRSIPAQVNPADDSDYKKSELAFHYRNGGLLFIGGMKDDQQREAIRSIGQDGSLDIAWMEEATAFTFEDFQELRPRMRGHAADWRQIICTTNPDSPNHWIYQKLILGGLATPYYSGAKDNTYNPADYLADLNTIEGVQYLRLVEGKWVQAEGVIFDNFDVRYNVTTDAEYNADWRVILGLDDGYVKGQGIGSMSYHPRVVLFCNITPQGGVNVFDEYVATEELSEQTITAILQKPYKRPDIAYVDSSASELKTRLHIAGIMATGGTHPVGEGIKNLRRLICDGQGVRMLKVHPRCTHLIREMASYRYDDKSKQVNAGEPKPLKIDDHSLDALRYAVWHLRFEG